MSILGEQIEKMLSEATARERAMTRNGGIAKRTYDGAREDSEPTDGLPRLRYRLDRLPARCGHCRSTFLEVEPPGMHAEVGSVTCVCCSRQAVWLVS